MRERGARGALGRVAGSARIVVSNGELRRLALVWGLWICGEWAVLVILSVSAYERGGTSAVAVIAAMRTLPAALAGPLTSLLADRLRRNLVLAGALATWCALVAIVPLALRSSTLTWTYLVVAIAAVTSTVLRPASAGWSRRWSRVPRSSRRPTPSTASSRARPACSARSSPAVCWPS